MFDDSIEGLAMRVIRNVDHVKINAMNTSSAEVILFFLNACTFEESF